MQGTMTGNRALFKINGEVIGAAQNVTVTDDFNLQEADGLGDVETQELLVGKLTHRIDGEKYFVNSDTLLKLGLVPQSDSWLTAPELTIELIDSVTGATIENYVGCKFNSHSRRYGKHQIVGESFSMLARHKQTTA